MSGEPKRTEECPQCDGDGYGPGYIGNCPKCGGRGKITLVWRATREGGVWEEEAK